MKPRVAFLLVLTVLLVAAGAFAVNTYSSGNRSVQALAETDAKELTASVPAAQEPVGETQDTNTLIPIGAAIETPMGIALEQSTALPSTDSGIAVPESVEPSLRFIAVGDIMLGRGVGMRLQKQGSYEKAFEKVAPVLKQGDVVFANLESPLTLSTHSLDSKRKIVLKGKPEAVSALTSAGFNVVSLANNHMMDYYETGLFDTMSILDANHILHAGSGKNTDEARKPAILERNGLKIGIIASSDMAELVFAGNPYLRYSAEKEKSGVLPRKYETIREDVMKLRGQVDLIAVSLHWGTEDSFQVSQEQRDFAHRLIDDGADLILGHHPHQFQGIELYKGKPILYSMGNFLFDQNEPENMESFLVDMKYNGTELAGMSAIPVRIVNKSAVEIQTGAAADNILSREAGLCSELGTTPERENDRLVFLKEKE